jgi:acyl-CoA thioesterase-1
MSEAISNAIRVTFFGDSICAGQGVSIYRGWVPRIAKELDDIGREIGREILVTNASVNGRTTRQALEDMPYQVQSHGVDILLVQFGLNDCNYWMSDKGVPRVSTAAFMANLVEIMQRGRLAGAKRILLNNNHPTSRTKQILPHTQITYEDSNRHYNEAVRHVARAEGNDVQFNDVESVFRDRLGKGVAVESLLLDDGLHLSAAGHDLYLEFMRPTLHAAISEFANAGKPSL